MQRLCDICQCREATLSDRVVENGEAREYVYCETCYQSALKSGRQPHDEACKSIARRGLECRSCGCTAESFESSMLFGCPDCYREMRAVAQNAVLHTQGHYTAADVSSFDGRVAKTSSSEEGFKCADECTVDDLVKDNVVSSRVRLARNVEGLRFPRNMRDDNRAVAKIIDGATRAAKGVFEARAMTIADLSDLTKKALVELHYISLPLANNTANGAIIVERGDDPQMSVMINEEDHLREQCVVDGHRLDKAYQRLHRYDMQLMRELPVAYDKQFGFLTACPTNVGTGMRASEMLFLPALRRAGAIDDALKTFKNYYGLTVRGYFGEGSEAAYDMYQISNSRTFGVDERNTVEQVRQAVARMCYCERIALEKLVREQKTKLIDGIFRSYGVLISAYSLTSTELMKLLVDVKIGVILGVLPVKSMTVLNKTIEKCASSFDVINDRSSDDERNKARARIVRAMLTEAQ